MLPSPIQLLRNRLQQLHQRIGARHWFPHMPLALVLGLGGFWLLQTDLGRHWRHILDLLLTGEQVTADFILQRVFQQSGGTPAAASSKAAA